MRHHNTRSGSELADAPRHARTGATAVLDLEETGGRHGCPRAPGECVDDSKLMQQLMTSGRSLSRKGLVVDDDAGVLAFATAVLSEEGYSVRSAGSVPEGFAKAVASDDPLDFLVTDYDLGSETGTALASAVRSLYPQVRILLISGSDRITAVDDNCVDAFLAKPFTPTALLQAVAELLVPVA